MTKKLASIALLLDNSGSMGQQVDDQNTKLRLLQTDANTFVATMRGSRGMNDHFHQVGIVNFNTSANVLFALKSISSSAVMMDAFKTVNSLNSTGSTNIADAIQKGKTMLAPVDSNTYNPAMVLFSDGQWNVGGDPTQHLPSNIPIYTIGYGDYNELKYLKTIANKTNANWHMTGDSLALSNIFDDIINSTRVATTVANVRRILVPYGLQKKSVQVSSGADYALFSLDWLERDFAYTDSTPGDKQIEIILYDPSQNKVTPDSLVAPDNEGFAVLRVDNPTPGSWLATVRYGDPNVQSIGNAMGVFVPPDSIELSLAHIEEDPDHGPHILAPITDDEEPLTNVNISAKALMPVNPRQQLFNRFENELKQILDQGDFSSDVNPQEAALTLLRSQLLNQEDIFDHQMVDLDAVIDSQEGNHRIPIEALPSDRTYNIYIEVSGHSPQSNKHFARTKLITVVP